MFHSEAVANGAGTGALTLGLRTGLRRIDPAAYRPALRADAEDPLHAHLRHDLRHRLLEMILRNEQRRRLKTR